MAISLVVVVLFAASALSVTVPLTETFYTDFLGGTAVNVDIITPDPDGLDDGALVLSANHSIYVLQVFPDGHCSDCISEAVYTYQHDGTPPLNFKFYLIPISQFNSIGSLDDSIRVWDSRTGDPVELPPRFFEKEDGDSFIVVVDASDSPDLCAPNSASANLRFWLEPELPCAISTNPFTPNSDGYNDNVFFTFPNLFSKGGTIKLFDLRGIEVAVVEVPPGGLKQAFWDGLTKKARKSASGAYIYVIYAGGERVCEGTLTLIR